MVNRLLNGLTMVVVGIILLMNTTGSLPWRVWGAALVYWPVLLIGLGVQVALSKWRIPGISLAIIAILILAAMNPYANGGLFPAEWNFSFLPSMKQWTGEKDWSVTLEPAVARLDLGLEAPAMDVTIAGLPDLNDTDPPGALEGDLRWDKYEPDATEMSSGDTLKAVLKSSVPINTSQAGQQEWVLSVNSSLATTLNLTGGVANLRLDASRLYVESLVLSAGVTRLDLTLGLSGKKTAVLVTGGVGNVEVVIPESAGVRISIGGGLTSRDFSRQGLEKSGGVWVTPGYDSAATKLDLTVNCGVGKVDLTRTNTAF